MASTEMKPQRTTPPWEYRVERAYRALRSRTDASTSYRAVLRSRTLSSARSSRSSGPRRRCPRPRCFLCGENSEYASETSTSGAVKKNNTSHTSFSSLLHWRWTMETQNMRHCNHPLTEREKKRSGELRRLNDTHPIYCSVLLNFLARYLAEALLGILTMDSSLP